MVKDIDPAATRQVAVVFAKRNEYVNVSTCYIGIYILMAVIYVTGSVSGFLVDSCPMGCVMFIAAGQPSKL